ncbi:MAG TPA: ParB/RepB/Spo0J family partition protein [Bryobacteraceae bacterium]|nr:ParB/RepB/Spo0J family partition protein [Bryobacteraceae bacterium]
MSNAAEKHRKALGKGLSALLPPRPASSVTSIGASHEPEAEPSALVQVNVSRIDPNPSQPRNVFDESRLEELAQSIRANGILQPLIVRRRGERYELVAGERRWRAAVRAGLAEVPALVQDIADNRLLELALIENIQREDLNPIEAAQAFERLSTELGLTQEEIGQRTGKDRVSIANMIRLLRLPAEVQQLVSERRLPMGQARALLRLPTAAVQAEIANKAAAQGLSTRQVEALVQQLVEPRQSNAEPSGPPRQDPNVRAAAEELERVLGTRVRITELNAQRGRIEIEYYSPEDLDRIYTTIVGGNGNL